MDFRLLRHLSYFKIVAEERHFGRAAKRLGISQPPLSQQIKILENSLGVRLFERSRKGVSLTAVGHQILPAVERLMAESEVLETTVMEARLGRTARISIGAIAFTMSELLPAILKTARNKMENLSIFIREFDSNEALVALENEDIDVAFLRAEESSGPLKIIPLVREKLVLALPNNHPLAKQGHIKLNTLAREPMVFCPREISPSYFDRILTICREQGLSPKIDFEARSITSQLAFVACGSAIGLVPESMQTTDHANVSFLPVDGDTNIVTAAIAWKQDNQNSAVQGFVEMVCKKTVSDQTGKDSVAIHKVFT
jgi:DNA-binding transcriptional LysR family regulator